MRSQVEFEHRTHYCIVGVTLAVILMTTIWRILHAARGSLGLRGIAAGEERNLGNLGMNALETKHSSVAAGERTYCLAAHSSADRRLLRGFGVRVFGDHIA
jgi:hypothetical protein